MSDVVVVTMHRDGSIQVEPARKRSQIVAEETRYRGGGRGFRAWLRAIPGETRGQTIDRAHRLWQMHFGAKP